MTGAVRHPVVLLLSLVGVLSACGHSRPPAEPGTSERGAYGVISSTDIAEVITSSGTAYELVRKLEPEWLRKRAPRSTMQFAHHRWEGDVQIYLNGFPLGDSGNLRNISADAVAQMRYLNAAEAVRYGTGHEYGAILVETW